jgi:hypothetical protein
MGNRPARGGTTMVTPGPSRHHPVVAAKQAERSADLQLRIADWITGFAGSMWFVYIHVVLFSIWMLFIEAKPWPMLTLIVSLEAIFLSTFVMIGQNRQSDFQQAKADHDFSEEELELKTNTELTPILLPVSPSRWKGRKIRSRSAAGDARPPVGHAHLHAAAARPGGQLRQ